MRKKIVPEELRSIMNHNFVHTIYLLCSLLSIIVIASGCAKTVPAPGLLAPSPTNLDLATITVSRPNTWTKWGTTSLFVYFRTPGVTNKTEHAICRVKDGFSFSISLQSVITTDEDRTLILFAVDAYSHMKSITVPVDVIITSDLYNSGFETVVGNLSSNKRRGRFRLITREILQARDLPFSVERPTFVLEPLDAAEAADSEGAVDVEWTRGTYEKIIYNYDRQEVVFKGTIPLKLERVAFEKLVCAELVYGTAFGFLGPGGSVTTQVLPGEITLESTFVVDNDIYRPKIMSRELSGKPVTVILQPGQKTEYVFTPLIFSPKWFDINVERRLH